MDLHELQSRAQRAREFTKTVDGRTFTLRIPTRDESLVAARRLGGSLGDNLAGLLLLQRALLKDAIVGWQGLVIGDVLKSAPEAAEPLPFEAGAVPLVLDANPEWADQLSRELAERAAARNQRIEAEAKN